MTVHMYIWSCKKRNFHIPRITLSKKSCTMFCFRQRVFKKKPLILMLNPSWKYNETAVKNSNSTRKTGNKDTWNRAQKQQKHKYTLHLFVKNPTPTTAPQECYCWIYEWAFTHTHTHTHFVCLLPLTHCFCAGYYCDYIFSCNNAAVLVFISYTLQCLLCRRSVEWVRTVETEDIVDYIP